MASAIQYSYSSIIVWTKDEEFLCHAISKQNLKEVRHATDGEKLLFKLQREDFKKPKYRI